MKISQEEIDAAWGHASVTWHTDTKRFMERALEAAYIVRKQRKAAKRERQRKEKDKQVVESVKPHERTWDEAMREPYHYRSKAPEWDGTFKAGEYQMRNGEKAIIDHIDGIHLCGKLNPDGLDCCFKWELSSGENNRVYAFDLIRPWPKGEQ